jgi:hypothetical protein
MVYVPKDSIRSHVPAPQYVSCMHPSPSPFLSPPDAADVAFEEDAFSAVFYRCPTDSMLSLLEEIHIVFFCFFSNKIICVPSIVANILSVFYERCTRCT